MGMKIKSIMMSRVDIQQNKKYAELIEKLNMLLSSNGGSVELQYDGEDFIDGDGYYHKFSVK